MLDFGRSEDARVQAQLDRLADLSVPQGRLGLETIRALMERLGNPHRKLPPVFHVAGTNGKGSVCAFLRAMLEADGKRVHVTTSPHLVRYNERIRLAGKLVENEQLATLLAEVLDASADLAPSFFEVTIAAAFLAFSRTPADACVVEVGLGGRFDATNVLEPAALAACGIAALGMDHERFLLAPEEGVPQVPMARIAFEKAGIAKRGVPLVIMPVADEEVWAIRDVARAVGAPLFARGSEWDCGPAGDGFSFYGHAFGIEPQSLPRPALAGEHQVLNASLAIAMLQFQSSVDVTDEAIRQGLQEAHWPARMQRLADGPLTALCASDMVVLDGGHNRSAGKALARTLPEPFRVHHLIIGMLLNKDPGALIEPLGGRACTMQVVPVPNHESHPASAFGEAAVARRDLEEAMSSVPDDGRPVLIAGSLYLAGEALRLNDEVPD